MLWMQVLELGRLFNFSKQLDRIELTLSLARAFFLMIVMARSVPQLSRRPTLYSKIPRGPDGQNMSRYAAVSLLAHNTVSTVHHHHLCLEEPTALAANCMPLTSLCDFSLGAWWRSLQHVLCLARCPTAMHLMIAGICWSYPTACKRSYATSTALKRNTKPTLTPLLPRMLLPIRLQRRATPTHHSL